MRKGMPAKGGEDGEGGKIMDFVAGFITARDLEEARKIAKVLLEKRLVSCCNIVPRIESLYWWKGKIEESGEALIIIKTRKGKEDEIIEEVKKIHSYDVPAIDFLDISGGNREFLKWIEKETEVVKE